MIPYRIPNLKYEGISVYTNYTVRAPQRGHGCPQIRFAIESQLDRIAEDLGIDPVTIRLRNARKPWEELPNGDNVHEAGLLDCIKVAAEKSDFLKKYGNGRKTTGSIGGGMGMGVSGYFGGSLIYPNGSGVIVKMNDDGTPTVLTGGIDVGQGSETVICQIVAEELGINIDDVKIISSDTDTTPQDIGAWISGMTYVTGNAARQAAGNVRQKMLDLAAARLNVDVENLGVEERVIFNRHDPSQRMSYREIIAYSIATRRGDTIIGEGFWRTMRDEPTHPSLATTKGRWTENYAFSAQVAEVEVDIETGEAKLVKALTVHDCGFPINPQLVKGQVDGQVSMALGHAFMEEILTKDGYTLNPNWLDYRMPTIHNMAISEDADVITEQYRVGQPYRTKEVGEGLVGGILAAMGNAVYDATGVRMHSTPFSAEKILAGLRALEFAAKKSRKNEKAPAWRPRRRQRRRPRRSSTGTSGRNACRARRSSSASCRRCASNWRMCTSAARSIAASWMPPASGPMTSAASRMCAGSRSPTRRICACPRPQIRRGGISAALRRRRRCGRSRPRARPARRCGSCSTAKTGTRPSTNSSCISAAASGSPRTTSCSYPSTTACTSPGGASRQRWRRPA